MNPWKVSAKRWRKKAKIAMWMCELLVEEMGFYRGELDKFRAKFARAKIITGGKMIAWAWYKFLCAAGDLSTFANKVIGNGYVGLWSKLGVSWFDHRFDYLRGPEYYYWQERGVLGNFSIKRGSIVLDLCCGDGFYDKYYFSKVAVKVDAIDRNERAIALARRKYGAPNIEYFCRDVLKEQFPLSKYDAILMMGAIEHFSREEQDLLLRRIASHLTVDGKFIGSTAYLQVDEKANEEHQREFHSSSELADFLNTYFGEVILWKSVWSKKRTEVYFLCHEAK